MKFSDIDSSKLGFELSKEFGDFDEFPVEDSYATYGNFQLVGNGRVTNENCGKFKGLWGCLHDENHDIVAPDGKNYKGKVFIKKARFTCHKPSCPTCYKYGWAVREAKSIEARLVALSKRFGEVEHIVISVPSFDYGLSLEQLRKKAVKILYDCGIIGGCLIFHGFRYADYEEARLKNVPFGWRWSIHFHVLGFVLGGYGRCRHCKKLNTLFCSMSACFGFEARVRRENKKNGYIIRVMDKRKKSFYGDKPNIMGTAWYQLNHATVDVTKKRFHVVTWFGVASYRKFRLTRLRRKSSCPICGMELERVRFNGNPFVMNEDLSGSCRSFYPDAVDASGHRTYVKHVGVTRYG